MDNKGVVITTLEDLGYVPVQVSENKIRFAYISSVGYILVNMIYNVERNLLLFQGAIPFDIKGEKEEEVLLYLNHINTYYYVARFLYNRDINRVVVESSIILLNVNLTKKLVENTLKRLTVMIDIYGEGIKLILAENVGFENAFNKVRQF